MTRAPKTRSPAALTSNGGYPALPPLLGMELQEMELTKGSEPTWHERSYVVRRPAAEVLTLVSTRG